MSTTTIDDAAARHGRFRRLYYGETRFEFVRRKRFWFLVSSAVILAGIISLAFRGLNLNIEFVGGTSWQVPSNGVTVQQVRNAVGLPGATITTLGTGAHQSIEVEAKLGSGKPSTSSAEVLRIQKELATLTHHSSINSVSVQQVGPTWGSEITSKAIEALIVFFILIALYISIFFEWKMALAAIIAVAHDILVTVGIYSLTYFLVTPDTVVAFLTVLGYSLYDTIVVFDRVRDNMKGIGATGKLTLTDVVNLSMNQTLARSINTSLVAILPILAVLVLGAQIFGATTLQYFGLALLVGLASGAYSSIFIASPLVAVMKEREPRYTQIRQRLESRGAATQLLSSASVAGFLEERESRTSAARPRKGRKAPAAPRAERLAPLRPGTGNSSKEVSNLNGSRDRPVPDEELPAYEEDALVLDGELGGNDGGYAPDETAADAGALTGPPILRPRARGGAAAEPQRQPTQPPPAAHQAQQGQQPARPAQPARLAQPAQPPQPPKAQQPAGAAGGGNGARTSAARSGQGPRRRKKRRR